MSPLFHVASSSFLSPSLGYAVARDRRGVYARFIRRYLPVALRAESHHPGYSSGAVRLRAFGRLAMFLNGRERAVKVSS